MRGVRVVNYWLVGDNFTSVNPVEGISVPKWVVCFYYQLVILLAEVALLPSTRPSSEIILLPPKLNLVSTMLL